ncbi:aspartate aminotransferase family protein [Marinobacterium iners]|uniref:4-aminobutyrate aminotransferase n=1 Tax=Marinobacterium iners DSM 11526 TaxID=1122198 RepID=A0A1H4FPJ2_9GAMM|nr:aspartate aminotransferase family protein [Marinobacterium iners]SEA98750.1 4-aminobutyrate aminotransferase [Marinobacterium iners DSM 11526]
MSDIRGILDQNAFSFDRLQQADERIGALVRKRLETVGPTSMLFYEEPLHIVRGEGVWLFDDQGQRYLDVYNNVPSVGHCHPRVVQAVAEQMGTLNVHTRYLHEGIHRYSERLLATLPPPLNRLVMMCTGSESNDMALRLARQWTGHQGIIVTEAAYHGNTSAVTEVSPSSFKKGSLPEHVHVIPISQMPEQADPSAWFADQVRAGVARLDVLGYGCAALLVDSIFSSDGVYADPAGFLKPAVEWLQAQGALLIADEVQPGFGRTGAGMWGFARHQVTPDVVTMGKPMGNGFPMAGLAAREELLAALNEDVGYFNTFGGSTVAVAAGMAVLDVLAEEALIANARQQGDYLKQQLEVLQSTFEEVAAVRGAGLFIGLDLCNPARDGAPDAARTTAVINALKRNGVLIGAAGKTGSTLKIRPPLCIARAEADLFLDRLEQSIRATAG